MLFASGENMIAIFGGVVVGVIVGAIPGLGAALAVALALPFTFYMDPITGILLLVGIYKGAIYGGSISAVLIKTPGTPAAACTVLDGFPLAQRGFGSKALNMALYSSCIADFISNLALILFTGFLASFALKFGPPEFFALVTFSLTIVAGVSGSTLAKGLISACLGLLLAMVGLDIAFVTERFSFHSAELMAGVGLIPVLIGLFAISEILDKVFRGQATRERVSGFGAQSVTWAEFRRCFRSILRGSLIGVGIGAIPGIGGAPAAFLSYSEAKRRSKHPETFGQGEIEGVAAAEAGNNGVCGATMIPLLALGVPGDIVTAILLGAFLIHGLQPGPLLFQSNLHMIYAIYCGILLSSICLFIVGKLGIHLFARIADVRASLLYPAVLVLCFFGAFVVSNSLFDVLVMIAMGIVGFVMLRADMPAAPFLIAFVLGPMFEDNLRRSLLLSDGDISILFQGPICWFFLSLTALTIVLTIRRAWIQHRMKQAAG